MIWTHYFYKSKDGLEVKRFPQSHTNYVRAGTRTYFSSSAYIIQSDVYYKYIKYSKKANLHGNIWKWLAVG